MMNQKAKVLYNLSDKDKDFSNTVHQWLAQYVEEDDFLSGKVSNDLPGFMEKE